VGYAFDLHVDVHEMLLLTRAARLLPNVAAVPSRSHCELTLFLEHGRKFTQHSIERDRQAIVELFPLRERRKNGPRYRVADVDGRPDALMEQVRLEVDLAVRDRDHVRGRARAN